MSCMRFRSFINPTYNSGRCKPCVLSHKCLDEDIVYFSFIIPLHHKIVYDFALGCVTGQSYFIAVEKQCKCIVWASIPTDSLLRGYCLIEVLIDKNNGGTYIGCQNVLDILFKTLNHNERVTFNRVPYGIEKAGRCRNDGFISTLKKLFNVYRLCDLTDINQCKLEELRTKDKYLIDSDFFKTSILQKSREKVERELIPNIRTALRKRCAECPEETLNRIRDLLGPDLANYFDLQKTTCGTPLIISEAHESTYGSLVKRKCVGDDDEESIEKEILLTSHIIDDSINQHGIIKTEIDKIIPEMNMEKDKTEITDNIATISSEVLISKHEESLNKEDEVIIDKANIESNTSSCSTSSLNERKLTPIIMDKMDGVENKTASTLLQIEQNQSNKYYNQFYLIDWERRLTNVIENYLTEVF